jgi:tRNA pseudouridine13 synthase
MKIKVRPEDFVVRELVDLSLADDGEYRVYLMEKAGWNTADAVESIAWASGVPASLIRYAGLKDRHALTCQYVSVPGERDLRSAVPDIRLTPAGFSDDFISTRVLTGNTFEIILRSLTSAESDFIRTRLPEVGRLGFPNYFDDQRFGSVTELGESLGERLAKGHLKGALRLYMTAEYPGHGKAEKERRRAISATWGDWTVVSSLCRTQVERDMIGALMRGGNKKNLLTALNGIPHAELAMHFAAFQSLVWNRSLQLFLKHVLTDMRGMPPTSDASCTASSFSVPGKTGSYEFYCNLPDALAATLRQTQIPTVARRLLPCPPAVSAAVSAALGERGLALADLSLRGIRAGYLRSFYRPAAVMPGDLSAGDLQPDDLCRGRRKMCLSFSLPRGSYATMLIKALTGSATPDRKRRHGPAEEEALP